MKHILPAAIVLAGSCLTGCITTKITTNDLRATSALIDVASSKSSSAVATCITETWRQGGAFGMSMDVQDVVLADGHGYAVFVKSAYFVQMLADVHDYGTGSTTKFYKASFVAGIGKFQNAVKDCQ